VGVCGGQRSRGVRRVAVHHRDHGGRLAGVARRAVGVEGLAQWCQLVGPHQPPRVLVPADQRHLRDDAPHPTVQRRDHQDVAPAVARPPDADPRRVDVLPCRGPGDGGAVVPDLLPGVDLPPRLAVARSQVAVVVHQHEEPRRREHLREVVEVHLLGRTPPVGPAWNRPASEAGQAPLHIGVPSTYRWSAPDGSQDDPDAVPRGRTGRRQRRVRTGVTGLAADRRLPAAGSCRRPTRPTGAGRAVAAGAVRRVSSTPRVRCDGRGTPPRRSVSRAARSRPPRCRPR
jgi:hypothetical protein